MTRVTGRWIDRVETRAVCHALTDAGYRALFVGGCVRNALLDETVSDIDIGTDAAPETTLELAERAGLKAVPTGIDHGTITVVSSGLPHEVTTFRHDIETDGRRAVVAYAQAVGDDARRRDFTMNALYAHPDGTLIDPLGGLPDLRARRVRFIADARARIREDYLRILRFFRFHARYGDPQAGIDPEGLAACAALSEGLEMLSKERVGAEMLKLLGAADPAPAVAGMYAAGCLARILPGAGGRALFLLVSHEAATGVLPDPIRRLAVLGGQDRSGRLRLSRADARRLGIILENAGRTRGPAELAYRHGAKAAYDIILARAALSEAPLPAGFEVGIDTGATAQFPVKPADLAPDLTGAALGLRLKELKARWIASGFTLTKDDLSGG